jgi:glutamyl endopeptidase
MFIHPNQPVMRTLLDEILSSEMPRTRHAGPCHCAACAGARHGRELQYDIIGTRDTRVLTTDTKAAPFRYICQLELNGRLQGSGTLIGPKTVLTAAHCLWDDAADARLDLSVQTLRVVPGRNGAAEPFGSARAVKLIVAPGYSVSEAGTRLDYGIIHLDKAIGNTVGFWNYAYRKTAVDPTGTSTLQKSLPLPAGTLTVNLSGYPDDKGGTKQYRAYNRTVKRSDGMLYYLNDTYYGHSGSPVWVRRHPSMGGRMLVAIHVGQGGATASNPNLAVLVGDDVRNFIRNNTI